jgi:hypothetical protein
MVSVFAQIVAGDGGSRKSSHRQALVARSRSNSTSRCDLRNAFVRAADSAKCSAWLSAIPRAGRSGQAPAVAATGNATERSKADSTCSVPDSRMKSAC